MSNKKKRSKTSISTSILELKSYKKLNVGGIISRFSSNINKLSISFYKNIWNILLNYDSNRKKKNNKIQDLKNEKIFRKKKINGFSYQIYSKSQRLIDENSKFGIKSVRIDLTSIVLCLQKYSL